MAIDDQYQLNSPVSSDTGYADNAYAALVDKWDNATGLADKDMGDVYLTDGDGNQIAVPDYAMADEDSFLDWLDEQDLPPPSDVDWDAVGPYDEWWDDYDGFELYTNSFVAPVGYSKEEG